MDDNPGDFEPASEGGRVDPAAFVAEGAADFGFEQSGERVAVADGGGVSDVDVLNFALSLELMETEFYGRAFDRFDEADFRQANHLENAGEKLRGRVYDDIQQIRENEQTHAEVLRDVIERLGGEPATKRTYEFPLSSVDEFIETARDIENTGVTAYNGALALIDDTELQTRGATIATVEARHGSYLKVLTDQVGFPEAFDGTRTREEVLEIVDQFMTG